MELWLSMSLSLPIVSHRLHRVRRELQVPHLHHLPQELQAPRLHHLLHFNHQKARLHPRLRLRLFRDLLHLLPRPPLQSLPLHPPFLLPQREVPHLPPLYPQLLRGRRPPHPRPPHLAFLLLPQGLLLFQELQREHQALLKSLKALRELQRGHRHHLLPRLPLLYLRLPQEPRVFLLPGRLLFRVHLPTLLRVLRQRQ